MKTLEEKNARAFKALNKCIAANANANTDKVKTDKVKTKKSTPSKMPRLSSRSQRIKKSSPKPKATTKTQQQQKATQQTTKTIPKPQLDLQKVKEEAIHLPLTTLQRYKYGDAASTHVDAASPYLYRMSFLVRC